ncbi:MAG: PAS domain S-box protein [Niastella sp.]|uniref:PAS domain-containing sensor histidine kinase n=1 Tax=Niastella sp. TaxID=1869183 RepID=UPI00389A9264
MKSKEMPQLKRPNNVPETSSRRERMKNPVEADASHLYTQQLIQALPAAIYTCDASGHILTYNKAAVALWGREPEPGKDVWCGAKRIYTMDGKVLPFNQSPMAIAIKEGREIQDAGIIMEWPDGTRRIVKPHPRPFFNATGKVTGGVNMLEDITDHKNIEESHGHFAAIVESSDDAIISKTLGSIVTSWNNSAERIFGYTAEEMIGVSITKIVPPDRLDEEPQILERLKRGERIDHFETKRLTKDGRLLDISLSISPVKNSKGVIIGASKIARDITAQKRAEQLIRESEERLRLAIESEQKKANDELEKMVVARTSELLTSNSALERSNHELEQFAYIASHDLQEPLRKIQTFADMVREHLDDSQLTEKYFNKIYASAKRMSKLINDVLNYSRLTKTGEQFQETDLNKVLKDVLSDYELLIEQKQAVVTATDLPIIKGIPLQLHQLFANLISNSLKFSETKPVISITSTMLLPSEMVNYPQLQQDIEYVKLVFTDNGIGFEQQYAEQIFIIFQRLNNMRSFSGTGIGLALCKKIVDHHDGIITAKSAPESGASFTIILPINHP